MHVFAVILLIFSLFVSEASAEISEQGTGMLFGSNHAYYVTAPKGWVLDNQSGVSQGLHMVFYPVGQTWADSPMIVYGKSVSKGGKINFIQDQVNQTLEEFHTHGSPNYKAKLEPSFHLSNNAQVVIFYFEGDQWGNFEAAGYIEEEKTFNYLVFNARTKEAFEKYITSFPDFFKSYKNAFTGTAKSNPSQTFAQLVAKATQQSSSPEGRAYEKKVIETLGSSMANFMRDCTSYAQRNELSGFQLVFRITPDGKITESYAEPENGLSTCFKGLILNINCPPHEFDSFLHHIDMKIKE